ncbi:SGT1 and CS domain protein [Penicillium taxi]|uniref:SGT1 and CS domain protein n=1 Tax=Penicillium taxi TaxID=168475 RepID=UPI0025458762|nr:SGT1 and CS domain protein [Penicillium taxi]KAJ5908913.1 SGT1 and CS domain protein [Penicillium taxi]
MDLAKEAAKAASAMDYTGAIDSYTRALIEMPRAAPYYIERSKAYTRLSTSSGGPKHHAALRDAEIALTLSKERGSRELILSSQMRRAISLYNLGRLGDAEYLFSSIEAKIRDDGGETRQGLHPEKIAPSNGGLGSAVSVHLNKVRRELSDLPDGDEKARVVVSVDVKGLSIPTADEIKAEFDLAQENGNAHHTEETSSAAPGTSDNSAHNTEKTGNPSSNVAAASSRPEIQEFRHEWYQSHDSVVVIMYVKGASKDSVELKASEDSISGSFLGSGGSVNIFNFSPLYAPITGEPTVSVKINKIEMTMQKKIPGKKWHSLKAPTNAPDITDRPVASAPAPAAGPVYPTSSRHGTKDWDKTINDIVGKMVADGDVQDSSQELDAGGDAVNDFFKKLYASADPDSQRAMQKSFIESNGTSLSTNWDEVGKTRMEPHPPT